jgi:hypothetical protein
MVIALAFVAAGAAAMAVTAMKEEVATGILPGDKGMALAFAATAAAAATFVGGGVGVCAIIGMAWREGLIKLCEY